MTVVCDHVGEASGFQVRSVDSDVRAEVEGWDGSPRRILTRLALAITVKTKEITGFHTSRRLEAEDDDLAPEFDTRVK